jgi:hypothetical protein
MHHALLPDRTHPPRIRILPLSIALGQWQWIGEWRRVRIGE